MTLSTVTLSLYYNRYLLAPFIMHIFLYLLQFIIKRYYRYIVLIFFLRAAIWRHENIYTYPTTHLPRHIYPTQKKFLLPRHTDPDIPTPTKYLIISWHTYPRSNFSRHTYPTFFSKYARIDTSTTNTEHIYPIKKTNRDLTILQLGCRAASGYIRLYTSNSL